MKLFAPRACVHLTDQFFPDKPAGRRGFFLACSPLILIFFFYVYAILVALVVTVWLTLLALIWVAQLIVLPAALIHGRMHPPLPPPEPRFTQHEIGDL